MPFLLLMPSYNQARYIGDAVRSVLAQDDPDWELWIVDNSTDATPEVLREFGDPRIRFHHIPQRMDPGSCLNWMLERARGELFSYVHTDNNLYPHYVARLRGALASRPLGLAYCDMGTLDEHGASTGVFRRGAFDLARLFSLAPLGVPFAATTALARAVGGFSVNDLADDVRFCTSAYGLAEYVHVDEPLLDYRQHQAARWTTSGWPAIRSCFLDLFLELQPRVAARGAGDPVPALARRIVAEFEAFDADTAALGLPALSRRFRAHPGVAPIDALWHAGLLQVPSLAGTAPGLRRQWLPRGPDGRVAAWPWELRATRPARRRANVRIGALVQQLAHLLPSWAYLRRGGQATAFAVGGADFRTVIAAQVLHGELAWQPTRLPGIAYPRWVRWPRASGGEPVLRCANVPSLEGV